MLDCNRSLFDIDVVYESLLEFYKNYNWIGHGAVAYRLVKSQDPHNKVEQAILMQNKPADRGHSPIRKEWHPKRNISVPMVPVANAFVNLQEIIQVDESKTQLLALTLNDAQNQVVHVEVDAQTQVVHDEVDARNHLAQNIVVVVADASLAKFVNSDYYGGQEEANFLSSSNND